MRWRICYVPRSDSAALAAILEKPTPRRPSPFVHLKAGSEKPPIFIAHGLCGTVQFTELAKHIRTGHPIYGIQGKGLDEIEEPLERVEDMAKIGRASCRERVEI